MKELDEDKILAVLYANFHGKSRKINDWMFLAEKVKQLENFYGSYQKVASNLGISNELVRETLKLLELPHEIQQYVKDGKLKHEVAWRITSVKGSDNQIKIAKKLIGLKTHEARDILRIFREDPSINIDELLNKTISKKSVSKISLLVVPVSQIDYLYIKKEAHKKNISPSKLLSEIIIPDWVKKVRK